MIDTKLISPKKGKKYSPNLHAWLCAQERTQPGRLERLRVYRSATGILWIGFPYEGDFIGVRMMAVLCSGKKARTASWGRGTGPLEELPTFWADYLRIGRCAIDPHHDEYFVNSEDRFEVSADGNSRRCTWCGAQHALQRTERVVVDEKWIPTEAAA